MAIAATDLSTAPLPASPASIGVALFGLGQVGAAVARALLDDGSPLAGRVRLDGALVRDPDKRRGIALPPAALLTTDPDALLARNPDVVVELLGGVDRAFALVARALDRGIPVVTANKSLLAAHGPELEALAARRGVPLLCEASVLAGVPFLNSLSQRRLASGVTRLTGIVNGTSNFILSRMAATGEQLEAALREAQARGLAEPDAGHDLRGLDAAEKLSVLLQHLGWGHLGPGGVEVTGLDGLRPSDIEAAAGFDGVIKPVVFAERRGPRAVGFVGPAFVPAAGTLARVEAEENAVTLRNAHGDLRYGGPGAGPAATAATILDDVCEAARRAPRVRRTERLCPLTLESPDTAWFVRLASDTALAPPQAIADILGSHGVWLRRTSTPRRIEGCDTVWLLTWPAPRARIERALAAVGSASRCETRTVRVLEAHDA